MPRGSLRVYLGVAPGVGTTHAVLDEALRRRSRGADVVVAAADLVDRPPLATLAAGLESVAGPDGGLDPAAVLARRPAVAVVDDLAAADGPATGPTDARVPRWVAVEELLQAGIDVVATTDVRALESLRDVVTAVTGEPPTGSVPDAVVRDADQVEVVDMTPQALRRRLAHGGLHPADRIDAARAATFRPEALAALRELALAWVAGTVPAQHRRWLAQVRPLELPDRPVSADLVERVLVGLPAGEDADPVMRRAARLAARSAGAELLAVHVVSAHRLAPGDTDAMDRVKALADACGAAYQEVIGDDVATALHDVATAERCTQVVVGAHRPGPGRRRPGRRAGGRGVAGGLEAHGDVDVHVVPVSTGTPAPLLHPDRAAVSRRRLVAGFAVAVLVPVSITVVLLSALSWVGLAGDALLLLLAVVVAALVGGLWPALVSAVVGSTVLNFFFIPPVHTLRVGEPHNVVTLAGFVTAGVLVSAVVHRAAAMTVAAARATTESRMLAASAEATLRGDEALPTLLGQLRGAFGMTSVSLLVRRPGATWDVAYSSGPAPARSPDEADVQVPAGPDLVLAMCGRTLAAADRTVLSAFAAQAGALLERDRLARSAEVAERLESTERLRDALLAAVGHDLRTPIASARAAVSSLRSTDVDWSPQERAELLDTAERSLERLSKLVADLLDLSRLRAGVLTVERGPVWFDEIVPPALDELGIARGGVRLDLPDDLPPALADPGLATRVVVNLLGNAVRHAPAADPPLVTASATAGRVELRVVDTGPGIPEHDLQRVFTPFQRLGDTERSGLGLGLALSRGLAEAMGGTLEPEETPGGGLTMVLALPAAPNGDAP